MNNNISLWLCGLLWLGTQLLHAQSVNWHTVTPEHRHLVHAHTGLDNGVLTGVGYGYLLTTRHQPILLSAQVSAPAGRNLFDDYKLKLGGQMPILGTGHWKVGLRLEGVFRRTANYHARLVNFGADLALTSGYYRPKWFVAAEASFDKALTTHIRYEQSMLDSYPQIQGGWFGPSTGGLFYYGLQTGLSLKRSTLGLQVGRSLQQDFVSTPAIPFYARLSYSWSF